MMSNKKSQLKLTESNCTLYYTQRDKYKFNPRKNILYIYTQWFLPQEALKPVWSALLCLKSFKTLSSGVQMPFWLLFDNLQDPGCRLSRHRWCLFTSFTALQVEYLKKIITKKPNCFLCDVLLPDVAFGFTASLQCVLTRLNTRRRATSNNSTTSLRPLIAMTCSMCSMGTHALRILRGVVDLTWRSHAHWRGHRRGHGTHVVKHWRAKA